MRVLFLLAVMAVGSVAAQPVSEAQLRARLARTLDSLAAAGAFSGVVAVAHEGTVVFSKAYGFADREAQRPNTVETAFNVGSINKIFTALAIRQLEAEGTIHADSTLGTYWPDYPNVAARRVTIGQLLEHRSGLGGNIFGAPGASQAHLRHNRDFVPLFVNEPLQFEPGTNRRYSNAGYVVLGELVERLSGEDYYAYVERHIYAPAGMTHTAHHPREALPEDVAIGYTQFGEQGRGGPWRRNDDLLPGRGSAAGGGYSTAGDLLRFVQALRTQQVAAAMPPGIGIAGGAPGINGAVEGDLPGGYDLVVLANQDPPTAEQVVRLVRDWLGAGPGERP